MIGPDRVLVEVEPRQGPVRPERGADRCRSLRADLAVAEAQRGQHRVALERAGERRDAFVAETLVVDVQTCECAAQAHHGGQVLPD